MKTRHSWFRWCSIPASIAPGRNETSSPSSERGFTLVEMIIVMVIMGIIGGMMAVFIKSPVQGYIDSARRAELTDIADTTLRRVTRDVRLSLPNSVRIGGSGTYLEFILTSGGGRYRAEGVDNLDFASVDTSFDVLGPAVAANAGDSLVIYNLGQCSDAGCADTACATPGADAYQGCNRRTLTSGGSSFVFTSTLALPFDSPSHRFYVVSQTDKAVTYACENIGTVSGNGTGTLTRYAAYGFNPVQQTTGLGTGALLAKNVSACNMIYTIGEAQRNGLVSMQLAITQNGETVSLYHEVHVSNVP